MSDNRMNTLLTPELKRVLDLCTTLPSLPAIALKIIDAGKEPDITNEDILAIISLDPSLSAKLLKVANSSLYSQPREINNLNQAIMLLGSNAVLTIALCFTLPLIIKGNSKSHANYWKRSILAASIAKFLGAHLKVDKLDELFLASLLQDIGILVIQNMDKSPYRRDKNKNKKHRDYIQIEKDVLGVEHPHIGAWLLKTWGLPDYIVNSVRFSHSLNIDVTNEYIADVNFHYCVSLSGDLADVWLDDEPDELLQSIVKAMKTTLDIDEVECNQLIIKLDNILPEISSMFNIFLVEESTRRKVLELARERLIERSIHSTRKNDEHIIKIIDQVDIIEQKSQVDNLTKAYSREFFYEKLQHEFDKAKKGVEAVSLAFIDIDNFKLINDTYGHLVGDEALTSIAQFFIANTRSSDIVARYGGDEFLLMLCNAEAGIAKQLLEKLLQKYEDEIEIDADGMNIKPYISIGLVTFSGGDHFSNVNMLIDAADKALYMAKNKDKNSLAEYSVAATT